MPERIEIDGSHGEGGGQVLRTSLCLSAITGVRVHLTKVRAGRSQPGLRRQHLKSLEAIARVCSAHVQGAELGSQEVLFEPGPITSGHYHVQIGTAGSTTLVLQTMVWALMLARGPSSVVVEGGTHNPMAPSADFIDRSFVPAARRFGARLEFHLERYGFYPAGGGRIEVSVEPSEFVPTQLFDRGPIVSTEAVAIVSNLPISVARRELNKLHEQLGWKRSGLRSHRAVSAGLGNALCLNIECERLTTVVTQIGRRGVRAEQVAELAATEASAYMDVAGAAVDEHLADQLLIPMALAGGGAFSTTVPSLHTRTNAEIISRFLPVSFDFQPGSDGAWRVTANSRRR